MAHLVPRLKFNDGDSTDTDHGDSDKTRQFNDTKSQLSGKPTRTSSPTLFHKVKNHKSILALVVSDSRIYAGTQGGELLVSMPVTELGSGSG